MRQAMVNVNGRAAGTIQEISDHEYVFFYFDDYLNDSTSEPVSLTLPKRNGTYKSDILFPCFFNLLSEGANKAAQCRALHIEPNDYFGLLLATAQTDTAGYLTFTPIQ